MSRSSGRRRRREQGERIREGFVGVPRDWIERVEEGQLTVEQFGILVLVAGNANYDDEPATVPIYNTGENVLVARGEALVGARSFAKRHRMDGDGRGRVVRALERGERLGICEVRPARDAPPHDGSEAPPSAPPGPPRGAPPPTIVFFRRDRHLLRPDAKGTPPQRPDGAPRSTPPHTPPPRADPTRATSSTRGQDQDLRYRRDARAPRRGDEGGPPREPERHRGDDRPVEASDDDTDDDRPREDDGLPDDVRVLKETLEKRVGRRLHRGTRKCFPETVEILLGWIAREKREWPYTDRSGPANSKPASTKPWVLAVSDRCDRFMRDEAVRGKPVTSLRLLALAYRDGRISAGEITDEQGFWRHVLYPEYVALVTPLGTPLMSYPEFEKALDDMKRKVIADEGSWCGATGIIAGENGRPIVQYQRDSVPKATARTEYNPDRCYKCGATPVHRARVRGYNGDLCGTHFAQAYRQ